MNTFDSPGLLYSAAVTMLAVILFFYMCLQVGRLRGKYNIKAPAMTGHPEFECAVRVQMNTLEGAILFLPSLWVAAIWFGGLIPPIAGAVWIVGRVVYMQGYMSAPEKRSTGFSIQMLANVVLIVLAIWGVGRALLSL